MSKSPFTTFLIRGVIVIGFALSGGLAWSAALWFVDYAKMHGTSFRFIEAVAVVITVIGFIPMLVIGATFGIFAALLIAQRRAPDDERMQRHRKLVLTVVAIIIVLGCACFWLVAPKSSPLKLSLVRLRNEGTNGPEAIIHFTNQSTHKFHWNLQTFVLSNGVWLSAQRQPRIEHAAALLRSHQSWNHAVPIPAEAVHWKVQLRCQRRDTALEDIVEDAFKRVGMDSPFGSDSRRPILTNELEFQK